MDADDLDNIYVKIPHKPICGCHLVMTCRIHHKTGSIAEADTLRAELQLYRSALKAEDRYLNHETDCPSCAGTRHCTKGFDLRMDANALWEKCRDMMPESDGQEGK